MVCHTWDFGYGCFVLSIPCLSLFLHKDNGKIGRGDTSHRFVYLCNFGAITHLFIQGHSEIQLCFEHADFLAHCSFFEGLLYRKHNLFIIKGLLK